MYTCMHEYKGEYIATTMMKWKPHIIIITLQYTNNTAPICTVAPVG